MPRLPAIHTALCASGLGRQSPTAHAGGCDRTEPPRLTGYQGSGGHEVGQPQVVCLGETMAQLAPLGGQSVEVAETFQVRAAGAESNVALGLRQLGHQVAWVG